MASAAPYPGRRVLLVPPSVGVAGDGQRRRRVLGVALGQRRRAVGERDPVGMHIRHAYRGQCAFCRNGPRGERQGEAEQVRRREPSAREAGSEAGREEAGRRRGRTAPGSALGSRLSAADRILICARGGATPSTLPTVGWNVYSICKSLKRVSITCIVTVYISTVIACIGSGVQR